MSINKSKIYNMCCSIVKLCLIGEFIMYLCKNRILHFTLVFGSVRSILTLVSFVLVVVVLLW